MANELLKIIALTLMAGASAGAETLYVHSQKIALKAEPNSNSADVETVVRGDELTQIEIKGIWLRVQKGEKTGWVSKLFVNKNKPIGAANLATEIPASEAKTSRRRESSYSVSASSRGLMPVERSRLGREEYRSDMRALENIEKSVYLPADVEGFVKESETQKN